jgi:hypothetical protein
MKSRTRSCVQERDVKCDLDTIINEVRQEFRKQLVKRKELIARLGNAFESVGSNPESICKKIKNSLHQEIADEVITSRDIERYCLDKWKKKTKPKNDKLSFSEQEKPQQPIVVAQESKSLTIDETASNTSDSINQQHNKLYDKKDSVEASHEDDFTTGKILSHSSDKQECSQRVAIPKEKYAMVQDAMKKSKASIFVKFDGNNNFLGADPDVFDNSGVNHQDRNVQQSGDVAKGEHFKRHSKGNRRAVSDVRSEGVRE